MYVRILDIISRCVSMTYILSYPLWEGGVCVSKLKFSLTNYVLRCYTRSGIRMPFKCISVQIYNNSDNSLHLRINTFPFHINILVIHLNFSNFSKSVLCHQDCRGKNLLLCQFTWYMTENSVSFLH